MWKPRWSVTDISAISEARRAGLSIPAIAVALQASETIINRLCKTHGIVIGYGPRAKPSKEDRERIVASLKRIAATRGKKSAEMRERQRSVTPPPTVAVDTSTGKGSRPPSTPRSPLHVALGIRSYTRPDGISVPYVPSIHGEIRT